MALASLLIRELLQHKLSCLKVHYDTADTPDKGFIAALILLSLSAACGVIDRDTTLKAHRLWI